MVLSMCAAVIPSQAQTPASVELKPVFEGQIAFSKPVYFNEVPGKPEHYIVLEQHAGRIALAHREKNLWVKKEFLNIAVSGKGELGLLGFTFHPNFKQNRKYYVNYNPEGKLETVIEERVFDETFLKDSGTPARVIMRFKQDYDNHNGGTLEFGLDGYLYIGTGDGGMGGDPHGYAQNLNTFLGKMLRIDVDKKDTGKEYAVPTDNPFVGVSNTKPEIWAYGLRNPWKYSFDRKTGDLWVGDVGQGKREEISIVKKGDNLGWKTMEGSICYPSSTNCNKGGLVQPVLDYETGSTDGNCIIGGFVFRGDPSSEFYGDYIFGDHGSKKIWVSERKNGVMTEKREIAALPFTSSLSSFGTDSRGNLYAVGRVDGVIYRLESPAMIPTSLHTELSRKNTEMRKIHRLERGNLLNLSGLGFAKQVELVSVSGRIMQKSIIRDGIISGADLQPGLYFLRSADQVGQVHLLSVR